MKAPFFKKPVLQILVLFVSVLIVYTVLRSFMVYKESLIEGDRAPYLQLQTSASIVIRWNSAVAEQGVIHYGENIESLEFLSRESKAEKAHALQLTQLKPDTQYYYSVGDVNTTKYEANERRWFKTAPQVGSKRSRIWVIGDSGYPSPVSKKVRDAAKKWTRENPINNTYTIDVWLSLGDLAYTSGTNDDFQKGLFNSYPDLLVNHTIWPVYGNHDARRWAYFDIFSLPEKAEVGGVASGTEHYYSFDYANIHFVMLDSEDSSLSKSGAMYQWLEKDLRVNQQANKQYWTIVSFHHPPYTKGTHDSDSYRDGWGRMINMRESFVPLLEKHGVDLVMSGHSHVYERSYLMDCHYEDSDQFSEKNIVSKGLNGNHKTYIKNSGGNSGTIYVVAGASSKVDETPVNHPAMAVSLLQAGSVMIDVEGDRLTARYINEESEVLDEFSIEKRDEYVSNYAGCRSN